MEKSSLKRLMKLLLLSRRLIRKW